MLEYRDKFDRLIWVSPGSASFNLEQVEFFLPRLKKMIIGEYEPEPVENERGAGSHHAPHEAVCIVAAELECRLSKCGADRSIAEDYYENLNELRILEHLARKFNMIPEKIDRTVKHVVSYISSGECRRWAICDKCYRFSKCQKKKKLKRGAVTYKEWCHRRNKYQNRKERWTK